MDSKNFTKADLLSISLFEVRNIAKQVGVKSPTTYNKLELVDKVLERFDAGFDFPLHDLQKKKTVAEKLSTKKEDISLDVEETTQDIQTQDGQVQEHSYFDDEPKENSYDMSPEPSKMQYFAERSANYRSENTETRSGYVELIGANSPEYGFLRTLGFENSPTDAYVHINRIKRFGLRRGDFVEALVSKSKIQDNKPAPVMSIVKINGVEASRFGKRQFFDDLIPIYPNQTIKIETKNSEKDLAIRCIDMIAPIGKGQRAMIVSPPKAGKTTLLKKIANSISENYPDIDLEVLLVDERPEEVTDMQRTIKGNVWFSTFDEQPEHHIKVAEFLLERSKRLVEMGKDVVILMDSLTRLARANNLVVNPTGRTLSGGIDPAALYLPKKFFGSARNIEGGGSLTIIATALVDTGSRMDDVIFEEFKGTGNMEIRLDRKLQEKRIFPAIDLYQSGARREDLLLNEKELEGTWIMRKVLSKGDPLEATEKLLNAMSKTENNEQFIDLLIERKNKFMMDKF